MSLARPLLALLFLGACSNTIAGQDTPNGATGDTDLGGADAGELIDTDAAPEEAQLETVVLTQSSGTPVAAANVNCRYGEQGPNADTRHFRVFPAANIGGSTITEAILPIEVANSPDGVQPATLKLHRLTGDILQGQFELLSETPFTVPDQTLGEVRVPLNLEVAPQDSIVLEVAMGDGEQVRNLRFGYNLEVQTGPTYYASTACSQLLPRDLATLANPFQGGTFGAHSWLVSLTTQRLSVP